MLGEPIGHSTAIPSHISNRPDNIEIRAQSGLDRLEKAAQSFDPEAAFRYQRSITSMSIPPSLTEKVIAKYKSSINKLISLD